MDAISADAENLPFDDRVFDVAISSMVFGLVPNQEKMIEEMARVVNPGGTIALATHGPTHYAELTYAVFAVVPKRYMLGRRVLYWPRGTEAMMTFLQPCPSRSRDLDTPLLIMVTSRKSFDKNGKPNHWQIFDAGASWGYLSLEAERRGLVTLAMGGFDRDKAHRKFVIPENF